MGEYYFRTADLSVGYNGKTLIHDIEINLRAGDILTLIGPNGSGKSTILKSVTKHLAMTPRARDIVYIHPHFTSPKITIRPHGATTLICKLCVITFLR